MSRPSASIRKIKKYLVLISWLSKESIEDYEICIRIYGNEIRSIIKCNTKSKEKCLCIVNVFQLHKKCKQ